MFTITAFYHFNELSAEQVLQLITEMNQQWSSSLLGLILVSPEGVNGTIAGSSEGITAFKEWITAKEGFDKISFKDSYAEKKPFRRFKVDKRAEVITVGRVFKGQPSEVPKLTAEEWHQWLISGKECTLLDTRNDYEVKIGTFKGAIDPNIKNFSDFPKYVDNANLPKDKPVLMFCTGGVRCEKASVIMREKGYKEVYELNDGILGYLEKFPEGTFDGECFVFDHRVSVDGNLQPSKRYHLCPLCGNPGDLKISCDRCKTEAVLCAGCAEKHNACSKNCRNIMSGVVQHQRTKEQLPSCDTQE